MSLSPFFDANFPEYAALLSGGGMSLNSLVETERFRLSAWCHGYEIFDSGEMDYNNLISFEKKVWTRDSSCRPVVWFSYTRWVNAYPIRSIRRVGVATVPSRNGSYLPISVKTVPYTLLVKMARRTTSARVKPGRSGALRVSAPPRANPEIQQIPFRTITENHLSGGIPTITSGLRDFYTRQWSGSRTSHFASLKPRQYPVNPHTVRIVYEPTNGPNVEWNVSSSGDWNYAVGLYTQRYSRPSDPVHSDKARNKAIKRLIEAANADIEANLAQDVAQIGQTTRLIAGTATKIAGSVLALKQGNLKRAANLLFAGRNPKFRGQGPTIYKSVAENWLELQYGWKPLLQDIHGAFNALSKLNEDESFVHRVVASAKDKTDERYTYPTNVLPEGNHKRLIRTRSTTRYVIRYKIDNPLKSFLAQTGFTNPINLFWEILPFSFVVDWAWPIGPYLETLKAWDGLVFMDGSETQFTSQITFSVISYSGLSPLNPTLVQHGYGSYAREVVLLDRRRLSSFPSATIPSLKNPMKSVDHALNGLALMVSAFK